MRSLKPGAVSIDPIAQAPPRHANRLHHHSGDRGSHCALLAAFAARKVNQVDLQAVERRRSADSTAYLGGGGLLDRRHRQRSAGAANFTKKESATAAQRSEPKAQTKPMR
jgi:hypothetical protein